jgi:hypothetical protein
MRVPPGRQDLQDLLDRRATLGPWELLALRVRLDLLALPGLVVQSARQVLLERRVRQGRRELRDL